MIDIATQKRLHPNPELQRDSKGELEAEYMSQDGTELERDTELELETEYMSQDFPELGDEFFMCLPTSIPGFNMQKKEWSQ